MLIPIKYEEYHAIYSDHLMRDVDIPPTFRVIEVEYYSRQVKWFKTESASFASAELAVLQSSTIRMVTIS